MASTTNLGLKTVPTSDFVSPTPFNENFETLDKLGKVYVVANGTSGEWYYREWSDGRYECWLAKSMSNISMNSSWGNLWEYQVGSIAFPVSFASRPHMTITWDTTSGNTAFAVPNTGLTTSNTGSILLCSPVSGRTTTGILSIHVSGTKKA